MASFIGNFGTGKISFFIYFMSFIFNRMPSNRINCDNIGTEKSVTIQRPYNADAQNDVCCGNNEERRQYNNNERRQQKERHTQDTSENSIVCWPINKCKRKDNNKNEEEKMSFKMEISEYTL